VVRVLPDPVLKQVAARVGTIDATALAVASDLVDTMRAHERCVGMAANQIGELIRCVAVDVTGHVKAVSCSGLIVLFNPVVAEAEGAETGREGCLSVPELTANVRRAIRVVVTGIAPDGAHRRIEADAFEARALQHEIDHLDGILILDRVSSTREVFERRLSS
jgi:peptide deformylase